MVGDINTSGVYRIGGTQICSASGCNVASTSGIQNGTALQTAANFNIQSAAVGSVTAQIRALAGQTANLLQLQDSAGNINSSFSAAGDTLTLGRIAASGTVTAGSLVLGDGTTDNFGVLLKAV